MKKILQILTILFLINNISYSNSWEFIKGPGLKRSISAIEIDKETIFVGLYEKLFKSTDFGKNWIEIKYKDSLSFMYIKDINILDSVIFVQQEKLFISYPYYEFLKSTDNGKTWEEENFGYQLSNVCFITKFDNKVYAHIFIMDGNVTRRKTLKYDKNNDKWIEIIDSTSYSKIQNTIRTIMEYKGKIYLGTAIVQPSIDQGFKRPNIFIYDTLSKEMVSIIDTTSDLWKSYVNCFLLKGKDIFIGTSTGVYKSTDEGLTWARKSNGLHFKNEYYDYDYEIHKMIEFDGVIYAITNPPSQYGYFNPNYSTLVYSTDNGESWNRSELFSYDPFIVDMPQNFQIINKKLLISTLDGLFEVEKDLTKKVQLINDTLESGFISDFFVENDNVYATKTNNFIYQKNINNFGQGEWEKLAKLQSFGPVINFSKINNNIYAIVGFNGQGSVLIVSNDNGKTFRYISGLDSTFNIQYFDIYIHRNDSVYLTSTKGIFLSNDEGKTWQKITTDGFFYKVLTLLKVDNYIFGGTVDYGLIRSKDGGKTWEKLNLPTKYNEITIQDILYYKKKLFLGTKQYYNTSDKVFVNGEGIFVSTDFGDSWDKKNNGYPDSLETISLASYGDYIFAATNWHGSVYYSSNDGANWYSLNNGLAGYSLSKIKVFGDYLFAGTSVGLHRYNLKNLITNVEETEKLDYLYSMPPYPIPATNRVQAEIYWDTGKDKNNAEIKIYNIYGEEISSKNSIEIIPESNWYGKLIWNCEGNEPGVYIITIAYGTEKKAIKVIKN